MEDDVYVGISGPCCICNLVRLGLLEGAIADCLSHDSKKAFHWLRLNCRDLVGIWAGLYMTSRDNFQRQIFITLYKKRPTYGPYVNRNRFAISIT